MSHDMAYRIMLAEHLKFKTTMYKISSVSNIDKNTTLKISCIYAYNINHFL